MPDDYGVKPPKIFSDTLTLDPQLANVAPADPVLLGWHMQSRLSYTPLYLGLTYGDLDSGLAPYLSQFSNLTSSTPSQPMSSILPKTFAGLTLDTDLLDQLAKAVSDAAKDAVWPKLTVPKLKYANGQLASIGSVAPDGTADFDGPDNVVAGSAIKLPFSLSKRFPYASGNDVYFKFYLDKDALDGNRPAALFSGASLNLEGKASDGTTRKLGIIGGRSQTGGPAGAVVLEMTFCTLPFVKCK